MAVLVPHDFDPATKYCFRCGAAMEDFFNGLRRYCDQVGNVRGISHILCLREIEASGRNDVFSDSYVRALDHAHELMLQHHCKLASLQSEGKGVSGMSYQGDNNAKNPM